METQKITNNLTQAGTSGTIRHLDSGVVLNGRYQVQDIVGLGGMGAVYRARDLHFPKLVKLAAVKEMVNQTRDPGIQRTIIQNFEREANILATLSHPAIPRILDYFSQGDRSYLVMEFINGKNLEEIVTEQNGPISPELAVSWGIELCDVLQFLHSYQPEPIIFRDMKPQNVMLNQHNRLMLVDFGIAKHFEVGQRGTQVGTEGYSPPEQYRGEATPQADVYALGATLHHLLSNRDPRLEAPFSFADRPLRSINPLVPADLEAVINTALQYNPEDRFKDVAVMKEALLMAAKRTGYVGQTSTMSGTGTSLFSDGGQVRPVWVFECEDEIRGSPTYFKGSLYAGSYDNNLYALNSATGEFVWKFPTDGGVVGKPAVLDTQVIVGSEDGRLYALSTRSGSMIWSYLTNGPVRSSPRIAEGHVFIGSDDGYLHAVNIAAHRRSWRYDSGAMIRSTPFVSEDSVFFGTEDGDFFCLDFGGGERWRYRANRAVTSSPVVHDGAVYFTSLDWTLFALDAEKGWLLWRYRMGKPSISSPAISERLVFAGAIDGSMYAVDANTGRESWRFQAEGQVNGGAVIYKDAIYFGSVDQHLYCLDFRAGKLRWKFKTDGPITSTPIVFDDIVYFGSVDRKIYALLA
ncbi:MAG TPA: serine/threonine-protein kinase [Anaerolineales bacterium]|nr:serine/threonine-protein kinase [Anaerolineales bacterium]